MATPSSIGPEIKKAVFDGIDQDELIDLVLQLSNIPSPPGQEGRVGNFLYDWLAREGFAPRRVGLIPERFNVIGTLFGTGRGKSLLFSAHMDVMAPTFDPADRWRFRNPHDPWFHSAWREGDHLVGAAMENDKGPMACSMIAAKAIKEASVPLKGDLYLTMCPGELGPEPIDEEFGLPFLSKDLGAIYMMQHGGIMADYGIAAEGTDFGVSWIEAGKAFFKITLYGSRRYTPWVQHAESILDDPSPVMKAAAFLPALHEWMRSYEVRHTVDDEAGLLVPKVQIGAIRGGDHHSLTTGTDLCAIYLDVRIAPEQPPRLIYDELVDLLQKVGVEGKVELILHRLGYKARGVEPLVASIDRAHRETFGVPVGRSPAPYSSMWRDHNVFNQMGVPSVTYGPRQRNTPIEDFVNCARIYALIALDICSQPR